MFADAEIKFELTVDTKTGKASIKNLDSQLQNFEKTTKTTAQKVAGVFNTVGDTLSSLGSNITKFVTTPITGLGIATAKTAIDFVKLKESTMIVFDRMLGGADASEELYQSLLAVAKASTYSQETFLNAGKSLVGMGINANSTVKYLQAITDAVSAFGGTSQDIEELSTVFGKMAMKGKVDLEDIWSLTDKGVNALKILANYYGVTTDEMQSMISDGAVPAASALDVLTEAMQNGSDGINGYVQGTKGMASELKGGTLTGALDSLKSSFRNMSVEIWDAFENKDELINAVNSIGSAMGQLPSIMGPITSAVGTTLQGFADKLNMVGNLAKEHPELFEKIVSAIMKLASAGPVIFAVGNGLKLVKNTIEKVSKGIEIFTKITKAIKSFQIATKLATAVTKAQAIATNAMAVAQGVLNAVMNANPIFLIITAIAAVIAILVVLYNKCEGFRNVINGLFSSVAGIFSPIISFFSGLIEGIVNIFNIVVDFFKKNWQTILLFILNPFAGIFKILYDKFEGFRNFVNGIIESIKNIFMGIFNFISGIVLTIADYVKNAIILVVAIVATILETIYNVVVTVISTILNVLITISTWIYNNVLLPIFNFVVSVATTIYNAVINFINMAIGIFSTIASWIYNNVLLPIFNFFVSIFTAIYNGIANFIGMVISIFSTIANWIYSNVLLPISNFFSNIFNGIWNIISGVVNKIKSAFNTVANVVKNVFSSVKTFISNIFSSIAGIIKAPINGVIKIINNVLKSLNKIKVPDWVPGLGGKGVNFKMIPTLNVGTNYVQHEGLAYLHQGEAVVPKKYNPAVGGYNNSQPIYVTVDANMDVNKFGKVFINDIKTFSGGAKSGYIQGASK